VDFLLN